MKYCLLKCLKFKPISNHGCPFGREHALGMELYAVDVVLLVLQGHDLPLVALGGYLQALGETLFGHHPRVVASHGDALGQPRKDGVVAKLRALGGHAVKHVAEVGEPSAKHLADGLMAQAHAEHGLASSIRPYHVEQETSFRRNARAGAEDDLVKLLKVFEPELVVAPDGHVGTEFLHEVGEVVGEGVVIVDDGDLKCPVLALSEGQFFE